MTQKDRIPAFSNGVNKHPHVVILGAGASFAACPKGDKNGRKLPLMNSLVATLQLEKTLQNFEHLFNDFENLYTTLSQNKEYATLCDLVEKSTHDYFYQMAIPNRPNLYDYLILSLRDKDVIATFNWDPLLLQALRRHKKLAPHLPKLLFLHGNVAVGTCSKCTTPGYLYAEFCGKCNSRLKPVRLLYPTANKEYNSDPFIRSQWDLLDKYLSVSYYVTIFGYSAPKTDIEARKLMLKALKSNRSRSFSEMDIIDVKSTNDINESWSDFFYSHHYGIDKRLRNNRLLYYPRRSCDAHASAYLMNDPWDYNKFPSCKTISAMHKWIQPLIDEEKSWH